MNKLKVIVFAIVFVLTVANGYGQIHTEKEAKKAIVFIAGFDEGDNTYYANAKAHFSNAHYQVVDNVYALAEILNWLRLHYDTNVYGAIHIVSHSNPWRGLSMLTSKDGERITEETLQASLQNKEIEPLATDVLSNDTKIVFHSCGLGSNTALLASLKKAFTTNKNIRLYASDQFNVFGGKYTGHYLAKTYYGYYPTAHSPGPRQLAREFKQKYPKVKTNWEQVLKTRTEQLPGDMYTYRFNIPVEWEFEFEEKEDVPVFSSKQEIMDWILEMDELATEISKFNIPIEKFRWLTKTKGNTLTIKGKTTVLCVMQPVMQSENRYKAIDIEGTEYVKL